MNTLEIASYLQNTPDDYLRQEMQSPSGQVPQYLLLTEMQRRKSMRDAYTQGLAAKRARTDTVADRMMAQSMSQGLGALQSAGSPAQVAGGEITANRGYAEGGMVQKFSGEDGSYVRARPFVGRPKPHPHLSNTPNPYVDWYNWLEENRIATIRQEKIEKENKARADYGLPPLSKSEAIDKYGAPALSAAGTSSGEQTAAPLLDMDAFGGEGTPEAPSMSDAISSIGITGDANVSSPDITPPDGLLGLNDPFPDPNTIKGYQDEPLMKEILLSSAGEGGGGSTETSPANSAPTLQDIVNQVIGANRGVSSEWDARLAAMEERLPTKGDMKKRALLAAAAGMLSNESPFFGPGLGAGLAAGLGTYLQGRDTADKSALDILKTRAEIERGSDLTDIGRMQAIAQLEAAQQGRRPTDIQFMVDMLVNGSPEEQDAVRDVLEMRSLSSASSYGLQSPDTMDLARYRDAALQNLKMTRSQYNNLSDEERAAIKVRLEQEMQQLWLNDQIKMRMGTREAYGGDRRVTSRGTGVPTTHGTLQVGGLNGLNVGSR